MGGEESEEDDADNTDNENATFFGDVHGTEAGA
jgi:hypothetical protein